MTPLLSAKNIRKKFIYPTPLEILKGISLDVYPQESVAIMGASGEGKSTLLHILGTLDEPTEGTLDIGGEKATPHLRNRTIGFIFQAFNLLEDYTVIENVLMPALIAGKETKKGSPSYLRSFELLQKVGLEKRAFFPTKLLSGGERQRVAIARAFCNDPELILADEPSGNLDHATSTIIHDLLLNCTKELKKTLIVVTHDKELASLCNKTFRLCDGLLTQENI